MSEQVFVTREGELAQLQALLERAVAGEGQVCFVAGVAGTGKSALITEFGVRAQNYHDELVVVIGNCNAQTGIGDPYLPFREILALLSGDTDAKLAQGAITPENANRLGAHLIRSGQVLVEIAPDLINTLIPGAKLLALLGKALIQKFGWMEELERMVRGRHDKSKAAVVKSLAAESAVQQSHIFEQYTDVLKALAAEQPLILVLDDLQWADAASISLFFHLSRRLGESQILLIGTYRSDEVALGRGGERHPLVPVINEVKHTFGDVVVDLDAAQDAEGRQFVDALLASDPNRLSDAFRQALFQHTQGHPLFTVELLRHLQTEGDLIRDSEGRWIEGAEVDWEALPARVEGVIAERIGRLDAALRQTLTVASVEGERFTAEVVTGVRKVDDRELIRRLNTELDEQHHLVGAQDVRQLNQQRLCFYSFRHNLFQRYLYNSIAEGELAYLHEDVGAVSEKLYKDHTEEIAVQLAWHFEEAGLRDKAVGYLLQAGTQAIQLSAYGEAIVHLRKALALLQSLPKTPERLQQELKAQIALGVALTVTNASSVPEIVQIYARASELCQQLGDTVQLFPSLHGLWRFHLVCAHHQTAGDLAEQMLRQAESAQDADLLMEACWAAGTSSFFMGDLTLARERMERGIALYSPEKHRSHMVTYGQDIGVALRSFLAWALVLLGYPDQALKCAEEAIALAAAQAHPYSQGLAIHSAAMVQTQRREYQSTQERTETSLAHSARHGFPLWIAGSLIIHGWSLVYQGKAEEGIAQIRQGYGGLMSTGAALAFSYFPGLLADGYRVANNREAGLAAISEALASAQATGEHYYEAELYRLQGELLLIPSTKNGDEPSAAAAEAAFRHALDLAQRNNAKALQLRAAVSLLRLQNKQANQPQIEEARKLLLDVYQWYTEGLTTPDLQEAKALLAPIA